MMNNRKYFLMSILNLINYIIVIELFLHYSSSAEFFQFLGMGQHQRHGIDSLKST
jgi:hypothetical protein